MRCLLSCLLLGFLSATHCASISRRDADFQSIRTKLSKDLSKEGPPDKYFRESIFDDHYDGRFADHKVPYVERKRVLSNLIASYLATFADIGVETWLMHGTLLGWWWNKKILPWDTDIDVQVSEESMAFLAHYYNMSVYHYQTPRIPGGRDYLLEINPHYANGDKSDTLNVIDARWIDTDSGLFIDITTVRKSPNHPAGPDVLTCKDGHEFREKYIFPLRDTYFEGQVAKIPYAYTEVLSAEYGKASLQQTFYEKYDFSLLL
jgi:phosphorylcholine metabolism protein LicD